jgi:hypothetical protein
LEQEGGASRSGLQLLIESFVEEIPQREERARPDDGDDDDDEGRHAGHDATGQRAREEALPRPGGFGLGRRSAPSARSARRWTRRRLRRLRHRRLRLVDGHGFMRAAP